MASPIRVNVAEDEAEAAAIRARALTAKPLCARICNAWTNVFRAHRVALVATIIAAIGVVRIDLELLHSVAWAIIGSAAASGGVVLGVVSVAAVDVPPAPGNAKFNTKGKDCCSAMFMILCQILFLAVYTIVAACFVGAILSGGLAAGLVSLSVPASTVRAAMIGFNALLFIGFFARNRLKANRGFSRAFGILNDNDQYNDWLALL